MRLKRRILNTLDRRLDPRLLAAAGSVYLSVRAGERCVVRYDDGDWIHRYRSGVVVDATLGGPCPAAQDREARDIFLFDYMPRPGDTVVDAGAGIGDEVRIFSRLVGPGGRVVSIEAHPRTARCLARAVALNGLANVTVLQCAVTDRAGPVLIEDRPEAHIRNRLTTDATSAIEVPGRTLAEIIDSLDLDRVDLLKMNIEGAERAVLEGSAAQLDRVRHLTVSCHDFVAERAPSGRSGDDRAGEDGLRTFAAVTAVLRGAGFRIRTRPDDPRPWIPYYVYAAR